MSLDTIISLAGLLIVAAGGLWTFSKAMNKIDIVEKDLENHKKNHDKLEERVTQHESKIDDKLDKLDAKFDKKFDELKDLIIEQKR